MELRILTWVFPWIMAIFEFLMRSSLNDPAPAAFIGPTVGAASLGMLLPLTRARELHQRAASCSKRISFDRSEDQWAQWINVTVWLGFSAWAISLYLSLTDGGLFFANVDGGRTAILIGAILWGIAVLVDFARGGRK
ncbi:hypothetical protein NHH88_09885 [Oxalobacteraceae bacterium OTU3CAMAD1]|nr:hypothetical protein NHH88_09885 [Oxalobacteraceae bacterium OTU3CAMAD1]